MVDYENIPREISCMVANRKPQAEEKIFDFHITFDQLLDKVMIDNYDMIGVKIINSTRQIVEEELLSSNLR